MDIEYFFVKTHQGKCRIIKPRLCWTAGFGFPEKEREKYEATSANIRQYTENENIKRAREPSLRYVDTVASYGRRLRAMGESSCIKWNKCCGNSGSAKALVPAIRPLTSQARHYREHQRALTSAGARRQQAIFCRRERHPGWLLASEHHSMEGS